MTTRQPKICIHAIIVKNGKVLLDKQSESWTFPGNDLRMYEDPEDNISKHVLDETGLETKDVSFLSIKNDFSRRKKFHYVRLFYLMKWKSGKTNLHWFDPNLLPHPLVGQGIFDKNTLHKIKHFVKKNK